MTEAMDRTSKSSLVYVCQDCDVERPCPSTALFGQFPQCPYCSATMNLQPVSARENDKRLRELGWTR